MVVADTAHTLMVGYLGHGRCHHAKKLVEFYAVAMVKINLIHHVAQLG